MNADNESEESSSETGFSEDERRRKKGKQRCSRGSNNAWSFPDQFNPKSNGNKNCNPVDFEFFTVEELYDCFCENKTKISTIEKPLMFLRHLKDNKLITDELYQKLENSNDDNDMYHALECIQKCGQEEVKKFWKCVDQEHILQRYPQLSDITTTLKNSLKSEPSKKTRERSEDRDTGRERDIKKRKTESNSVSNQAGPSSQSTKNQRKKFEHVEKGSLKNEEEKDLWDMPKHKKWLPVTCGEKEALLDREVLRRYDRNKKCIKYRKEMIAPYQFEEMAGRGTWKNWKTSILCQDKKLKDLLEEGILEMPKTKRRNTYRE
ncbi:uncharacterized protein si:dkey-68o6.8 isoform X2 [Megalobrama amblycephala]|uniref:uncharacterized protein si:dkey-68o6.8 isoform X2 n=1 Tax=Megalobrama amblycephala TaxID=75352 RepID=UPI0020144FCF|nr:uncharacterized protein si:dkey-68o6.8 isoform X2 [Megalobrama amblycephala]